MTVTMCSLQNKIQRTEHTLTFLTSDRRQQTGGCKVVVQACVWESNPSAVHRQDPLLIMVCLPQEFVSTDEELPKD